MPFTEKTHGTESCLSKNGIENTPVIKRQTKIINPLKFSLINTRSIIKFNLFNNVKFFSSELKEEKVKPDMNLIKLLRRDTSKL